MAAATDPPGTTEGAAPEEHVVGLERAEQLREEANLAEGEGPSAEQIQAAIDIYVGQFRTWYEKQLKQIAEKYDERIVRRINPYVRRAYRRDCTAEQLAESIVADWDSRNFVTAGGQALEALAIAIGKDCQKAIAEGIDIQRVAPEDPATIHLYTVKSGSITRNTDIVGKMKQNLRRAERLAKQNPAVGNVRLNYATCVGKFTSTLADGVHRPSSARFWSEVMDIPEDQAIKLLWLVTDEGAKSVSRSEARRRALIAQVATYIAKEEDPRVVDWDFLVKVATTPWRSYEEEHRRRDAAARVAGRTVLEEADEATDEHDDAAADEGSP